MWRLVRRVVLLMGVLSLALMVGGCWWWLWPRKPAAYGIWWRHTSGQPIALQAPPTRPLPWEGVALARIEGLYDGQPYGIFFSDGRWGPVGMQFWAWERDAQGIEQIITAEWAIDPPDLAYLQPNPEVPDNPDWGKGVSAYPNRTGRGQIVATVEGVVVSRDVIVYPGLTLDSVEQPGFRFDLETHEPLREEADLFLEPNGDLTAPGGIVRPAGVRHPTELTAPPDMSGAPTRVTGLFDNLERVFRNLEGVFVVRTRAGRHVALTIPYGSHEPSGRYQFGIGYRWLD